jgi:acetolactate synthase-1/2/3 large subunit
VVIALPEDMLSESVVTADAPAFAPVETAPGADAMAKLRALLLAAERPLLLAGGSRWSEEGSAALQDFAARFALPVATTFRRTHLVDPLHPSYAGELGNGPNPKLVARAKAADLIVLIGGRLGELPSQRYTVLDIPAPRQTFVHVHPGAEELGRVYRPHLAIHAAPSEFARALRDLEAPNRSPWGDWTRTAHAEFLAWTDTSTAVPGAVNLGEIVVGLRDTLPADAVICNGAGNFSLWVHRFHRYRRYGTQLAPASGSMGYGLPAAVAMKRLAPERTVVCFAGDGDFLMTGQEFATAVQYELPIVVIVVDNGMYGTIRMHQEREYPGRVVATGLKNPDFAAYARAFGGFGATVEKTADFAEAFEAAQKSAKPAIIHLKVDAEAITPATTLATIRTKALAERA